jgi:hypothetical protein
MIDLIWGVFGRGYGDSRAGELFRNFKLVRPAVRRKRVVDQMLRRTIVRVGGARYQDDRQVFGIGSANRVDRRESADTECNDGSGRAACTRITLRAVAAIQLVTAIDLLQILIPQELVKQDQIEVTCYRKVMLQPYL